jgi:hypothetical protein
MVKSRSAGNPPGKAGFLFLGCAFWVSALASNLFATVRGRVYAARERRDKPPEIATVVVHGGAKGFRSAFLDEKRALSRCS